jgi:hypothetical protein
MQERVGRPALPTVVDHVPYDAKLVGEVTFGPVLPIIRCPNDIAEVIRIANATAYGLSSGVCTNRLECVTAFHLGVGGWHRQRLGRVGGHEDLHQRLSRPTRCPGRPDRQRASSLGSG